MLLVIDNINLLITMFIFDGLINAYIFWKLNSGELTEAELVKQYSSLYILNSVQRYIFYYIVYGLEQLVVWWGQIHPENLMFILTMISILVVVPPIQNEFMNVPFIKKFIGRSIEEPIILCKYSFSKIIINFVISLDDKIVGIKNYHIFILYNYITLENFYVFCKSFAFLHLLNVLKQTETTYYYYKAIKLAYYYNTGYLFNVLSKSDAIYIINVIIRDKLWEKITKIDVINALYTLILDKYDSDNKILKLYIQILNYFSVWSLYYALTIFDTVGKIVCLLLYGVLNYNLDNLYFIIYKVVLLSLSITMEIRPSESALIHVFFPTIYKITEEIIFYIKYKSNIKKVINGKYIN